MKRSMKMLFALSVFAFTVLLAAGTESKAAGKITGMKQTKASSSYVEVQWDAYLGAGASDVYYATWIGNTVADVQAGNAKKESAWGTDDMLSGLTKGAVYYVRVDAYANYSRTQLLASSDVIQVATSPSEVTGLTQTWATTNSISMKWNAVAGATGYEVYRYNGYSDYTKVATVSQTSATVSGLTASAEVPYFVCAVKTTTSGFYVQGQESSNVYMKTTPAKVSRVAMTYYWDSLRECKYEWTYDSNADGYQYEVKKANGKKTYFSGTTTSSYTYAKPFPRGVFIKARARAYITVGNQRIYGAWSSYSYSAANKKVTAKRSSNGKKIALKWKKISGASGYSVYISTKSGSGFKKVKTLSSKKTKYTITKCGKKKLKKGKTYYVQLRYQTKVGKKKVVSPIVGSVSVY